MNEKKLQIAEQITEAMKSRNPEARTAGYQAWKAAEEAGHAITLDTDTVDKLDKIHYRLGGKS